MSAGPRRIADTLKLRMKIGLHEFEADGPSEVVLAQVETWKQLAGLTAPPTNLSAAAPAAGDSDPALRQLFGVNADQKSITLRATLGGRRRNANAALLLLYGHGSLTAASNGAEMAPAQLGAALVCLGLSAETPRPRPRATCLRRVDPQRGHAQAHEVCFDTTRPSVCHRTRPLPVRQTLKTPAARDQATREPRTDPMLPESDQLWRSQALIRPDRSLFRPSGA